MIAWRITRHRFADLSGSGAAKWGGRWNSPGRPCVYLSEHPALAMLETLVHLQLERDEVPVDYVLMRVRLPGRSDGAVPTTLIGGRMDASGPPPAVGDRWLAGRASSVAIVPSVILPGCNNFLLNPDHKDAALAQIESVERLQFDERLLRYPM